MWSFKNICQSCMKAADPKMLFQNVEFLADLYEGSDTLVELLAGVCGRKLDTDTCLLLRNYRIVETGYVDTFLLHLRCEYL